MEEKIMKIKKAVKADHAFLALLITFILALATNQLYDIVQLSKKGDAAFEVKIANEGDYKGTYNLYIDEERLEQVNYNDYVAMVDENGNTNYKIIFIIEKTGKIAGFLVMALVIYFAYLILDNIFEPFSKRNIRRLRLIAFGTMLLSVLPMAVMAIMRMIYFSSTSFSLSQLNFFVLLAGVLFGILSEIFKYGYELQDEIDQIC